MKIGGEKALISADRLASCAMAFGLGYWGLSLLNHETAMLIAWIVIPAGAGAKLIIESQWRRLFRKGT